MAAANNKKTLAAAAANLTLTPICCGCRKFAK
jgi:hypothetical protein